MCQTPEERLLFCTCDRPKDGSTHNLGETSYSWTLHRFVANRPTMLRGKVAIPQKDLGAGVKVDVVLDQLNSIDPGFDFSYVPNQDDVLTIEGTIDGSSIGFFKLIYKAGSWCQGRTSPFGTISQEIAAGKLFREKLDNDQ